MTFNPERSKTQSDYVRERKEAIAKRNHDANIESDLATARQEATAYRISLENAEQLICKFIECRVEVGDTWGIAYGRFNETCKKANKLEAGE